MSGINAEDSLEGVSFLNDIELHSILSKDLSTILIMNKVILLGVEKFKSNTQYYDPNDSKTNNKGRMKELGLSLMYCDQHRIEYVLLALAKCIESILFQYKQIYDKEISFWDATSELFFKKECAHIRHLSNVIKHNNGKITKTDKDKDSGNQLIKHFGYVEGEEISSKQFNVEELVLHTELFCHSFLYKYSDFWKALISQKGQTYSQYISALPVFDLSDEGKRKTIESHVPEYFILD